METKIYMVNYQEVAIGYGKGNSFHIPYASKEKAMYRAEQLENRADIPWVSVTEQTAIDGEEFNPSGLVYEYGKFNPTIEY